MALPVWPTREATSQYIAGNLNPPALPSGINLPQSTMDTLNSLWQTQANQTMNTLNPQYEDMFVKTIADLVNRGVLQGTIGENYMGQAGEQYYNAANSAMNNLNSNWLQMILGLQGQQTQAGFTQQQIDQQERFNQMQMDAAKDANLWTGLGTGIGGIATPFVGEWAKNFFNPAKPGGTGGVTGTGTGTTGGAGVGTGTITQPDPFATGITSTGESATGITEAGNIGAEIGGYGTGLGGLGAGAFDFGAAGMGASGMAGIGTGVDAAAMAAEIAAMEGGMTAGGVGAGSLGGGTTAGAGLWGAAGAAFAPLAIAYGIMGLTGELDHSVSPIPGYQLALDQGIVPDPNSDQAVQYREYLERMFRAPDPNSTQVDLTQEGGGIMGGGTMGPGVLLPGAKELIDDFMADPFKYLQNGGTLENPFANVSTPIRQNYLDSRAGQTQPNNGNWWENPSP